MGPIRAVIRCYANILNFSGRARRAEYWWFFLFLVLLGIALQVGVVIWLAGDPTFRAGFDDPSRLQAWAKQNGDLYRSAGIGAAVYVLLGWLPQLSVTVRRLHDTDRSGWFILMPMAVYILAVVGGIVIALSFGDGALPLILLISAVPLIAAIWFLVVLCLPGSHGTNRFGRDPIPNRRPRDMGHPAFAQPVEPEARAAMESARRAEIKDYYRKNVLPGTRRV